jgi:hypothetical protein
MVLARCTVERKSLMSKVAVPLAAAAAFAGFAIAAQPATAQSAAQRVAEITVFGTDPCPRSTDDNVVICRRVDERYRYRLPDSYRPSGTRQERQSWASKARTIERVGRTGIQSCSPVGPAGYTGCMEQMVRGAREESNEAIQQSTAPEE